MDVYAWADDQRERRRREFYRLLQRGRDIFTPRHIFDRCCVKWLIDGSIQRDEYGGFYDDPFDPPSGCNGGCKFEDDGPICLSCLGNAGECRSVCSMILLLLIHLSTREAPHVMHYT
mmetsp:Transcript_34003/g.50133  ORF Transcript_34003/g.50133 Transcript_34003/m.50133 type:complete len:117 (+) Transcript_34003:102-452(+)